MDEQFQKVIMEWKIAMSEEQCRHAKETRRINEELERALLKFTEKPYIGNGHIQVSPLLPVIA